MSDGNSHHNGPSPLCHIVTPVGMLGFGFDELQTADTLAKLVATNIPTAIILDSGSTDSGPSKLALGSMSCPREAYTRDLTKLLGMVDTFHVPLIFSSAGGDGSDDHVKEILQVIEEIAEQEKNESALWPDSLQNTFANYASGTAASKPLPSSQASKRP